jgi:hypothetical protein
LRIKRKPLQAQGIVLAVMAATVSNSPKTMGEINKEIARLLERKREVRDNSIFLGMTEGAIAEINRLSGEILALQVKLRDLKSQ